MKIYWALNLSPSNQPMVFKRTFHVLVLGGPPIPVATLAFFRNKSGNSDRKKRPGNNLKNQTSPVDKTLDKLQLKSFFGSRQPLNGHLHNPDQPPQKRDCHPSVLCNHDTNAIPQSTLSRQ